MTRDQVTGSTGWATQVWGDTAVLFTSTAPTASRRQLAARELNALLHARLDGLEHIVDWVHAFESVLVQGNPAAVDPADLIDQVLELLDLDEGPVISDRRPRVFDVPAVFNDDQAPDLGEVATELGVTRDAIIASLVSEPLELGCVGVNMVPLLTLRTPAGAVRRLPSPRTRVAAGSIAMAGTKAVVCTGDGPSGWRIVARTPLRLFDLSADPMSSYVAGDLFRIRPIPLDEWDQYADQMLHPVGGEDVDGAGPDEHSRVSPVGHRRRVQLEVLDAVHAWVTDLGRSRTRDGLATNGALDQYAAKMANALVGNTPASPVIETLLTGLAVRVQRETLVAVTGGATELYVDDHPVPAWQPVVVPAGATVRLPAAHRALRSYLAVRGNWQVQEWAGSVAPDTALDIGHRLSPGTLLELDPPGHTGLEDEEESLLNPHLGAGLFRPAAIARPLPQPSDGPVLLDFIPGPDLVRFPALEDSLHGQHLVVDEASNHVGVRLRGSLPPTQGVEEVLSHGVPIGAVELTPADELIVLMRGRSLTAGYPVVGFVSALSLDVLGQLPPGRVVRLRPRNRRDCLARFRAAEAEVRRVHVAMNNAIASLRTTTARGSSNAPAVPPSPHTGKGGRRQGRAASRAHPPAVL